MHEAHFPTEVISVKVNLKDLKKCLEFEHFGNYKNKILAIFTAN
jgi:hypothetical protein